MREKYITRETYEEIKQFSLDQIQRSSKYCHYLRAGVSIGDKVLIFTLNDYKQLLKLIKKIIQEADEIERMGETQKEESRSKMQSISDIIGLPALLDQTAEECCELGQSCLKYSRKLRNENPTPKELGEITKNFYEEMADVFACCIVLCANGYLDNEYIHELADQKIERWCSRLGIK